MTSRGPSPSPPLDRPLYPILRRSRLAGNFLCYLLTEASDLLVAQAERGGQRGRDRADDAVQVAAQGVAPARLSPSPPQIALYSPVCV